MFGGRTNVTPVWNVGPSVQLVWPPSAEKLAADPKATTAAGLFGGAVPNGTELFSRNTGWYAFTSAYPMVLLSPSEKSPT